jgi:sporulation-control protein spo0M
MGFFDKVKSAAGVGTAGLEVDIRQRPRKRGEVLDALIRVKAGERAMKMRYLRVSFEYNGKWQIVNADGSPILIEGKGRIWYGDLDNSKDVTIEPGGPAREFPVQLRVPSDSPLSGPELKYQFRIRADIDDMKDPESVTDIEIVE